MNLSCVQGGRLIGQKVQKLSKIAQNGKIDGLKPLKKAQSNVKKSKFFPIANYQICPMKCTHEVSDQSEPLTLQTKSTLTPLTLRTIPYSENFSTQNACINHYFDLATWQLLLQFVFLVKFSYALRVSGSGLSSLSKCKFENPFKS